LDCGDSAAPSLFRGRAEISSAAFSCNLAFLIEIGAFVVRKTDISGNLVQFAWWVLATIVFTLVVAIRIRLLGIPLERDEGEYAYAGQLILQGIPPYRLVYNMKFPGCYVAYAGIMSIFGQTIAGIHIGLLLVNAATIILIFFLGQRLFSLAAGVAAASTYAVLSLSPSVLGLAAHATQLAMLPVLGGTLLLLNESDRRTFGRIFTSGLLFGIGLLMKQPALFFILFGAAFLLCDDIHHHATLKKISLRISIFAAGAIVPFGVTCLILWRMGVFEKFWFWTINYAAQYASVIPLSAAPQIFAVMAGGVIRSGWALWTLAGLGLVAGVWDKRARGGTVFLLGLLALSLLALSAGFYFREHYFIFILPAVSLLAGLAISTLSNLVASRSGLVRLGLLLLFCGALSQPILAARKFYFEVSPAEASRISYGSNPFPESVRIADYVRDHSSPSDTIAVFGSEPEIYFYSQRHSATGHIYTYGLTEAQNYARQMQEEMIREIELARPRYLIFVGIDTSWNRRPESEQLIFTWAKDYLDQYYSVVAFVNIVSADRTDYYFEQLPTFAPELANYILIWERKS
jgi:Dolichyl-phosphate-mannose-protein mannosyltransferase